MPEEESGTVTRLPGFRWLASGLLIWAVAAAALNGLGWNFGAPVNWSSSVFVALGFTAGLACAGTESAGRPGPWWNGSRLSPGKLGILVVVCLAGGLAVGAAEPFVPDAAVSADSPAGFVQGAGYFLLAGLLAGAGLRVAAGSGLGMPPDAPPRTGGKARALLRNLPRAVAGVICGGVLAGVVLGVSWGAGFAAVQGIRIQNSAAFPPGGTGVRSLPGGARSAHYPGGLTYVIGKNGARRVEATAGMTFFRPASDSGAYYLSGKECEAGGAATPRSPASCRAVRVADPVFSQGDCANYYNLSHYLTQCTSHVTTPAGAAGAVDSRLPFAAWLSGPATSQLSTVPFPVVALGLVSVVPGVIVGFLLAVLEFPAPAGRPLRAALSRGALVALAIGLFWLVPAAFLIGVSELSGGVKAWPPAIVYEAVAATVLLPGLLAVTLSPWRPAG